jgi:NAD(P)-dependent dehydrogenase (short-subunit alcohol dehydrogenase family)
MSVGFREHTEIFVALREVSVSARTLQRDQEPEDVVGAVVFLCGPGATFVTGQTIVIDGGQYFH